MVDLVFSALRRTPFAVALLSLLLSAAMAQGGARITYAISNASVRSSATQAVLGSQLQPSRERLLG